MDWHYDDKQLVSVLYWVAAIGANGLPYTELAVWRMTEFVYGAETSAWLCITGEKIECVYAYATPVPPEAPKTRSEI